MDHAKCKVWEDFELLKNNLDMQVKNIGEENIKQFRLCPVCLNYINRKKFDDHAEYHHGIETVRINNASI